MNKKLLPLLVIYLLSLSNKTYSQFREIALTSDMLHSHLALDLMGGGAGIIDYNNDGLEDLYFTGGFSSDKLYKNLGDLIFEDVSDQSTISQLTSILRSSSVAIADLNNDGFQDVFLTTAKDDALQLLLNNGDGTFSDISSTAGLSGFTSWSMGASMADVNRDGFLDIYVINYIEQFKSIIDNSGSVTGFDHSCSPNYFLINNGDNTFTEASASYGINDIGCGLATMFADLNGDHYPDLYIANDFGEWIEPNRAYIFDPAEENFSDQAVALGLNDSIYGMGISAGDVNLDGLTDFYVTNLGRNVLRIQNADHTFSDKTTEMGVENTYHNDLLATGWGTVIEDFDNNGTNDLAVANGYIPAANFIETAQDDPNKLYLNAGGTTYIDNSVDANYQSTAISRGLAKADLNNDGYPELITTNLSRIRYSWENNVNIHINEFEAGNWLAFVLERQSSTISSDNSLVHLFFGAKHITKELIKFGSHASSHSDRLFFGLPSSEIPDSIKVQWSPEKNTSYVIGEGFSLNRYYKLVENEMAPLTMGCNDAQSTQFDVNFGCPLTSTDILLQTTLSDPTKISQITLYDATGKVLIQHATDLKTSLMQIQHTGNNSIVIAKVQYIDGTSTTRKFRLLAN